MKNHRTTCVELSHDREGAAELSGNPQAWKDLMDWVDFHHDSFMNTALQCYLYGLPEETFPGVATDNYTVMCVWYRNDPTLPLGQKFELRGCSHLAKADTPPLAREIASEGYEDAILLGKTRYGDSYRGTGTYMLEVRFRSQDRIPHPGPMPTSSNISLSTLSGLLRDRLVAIRSSS
ncbi:hypothetical protein L226DRAFT_387047 [Lentinus tigrinus ALCF2SS1-7]|uniref:Uncharacterized protein n=1 Tax=Lentinus tigrinus ALCF2SS1-6 TaxID=1328759 RepID=A0A5C2SBL3_9APHY|nr:hypothetical protein L227DRAFT_88575 [Lentinus tigrinus ALCF2SS1-6]RPD75752.1 hypothetical protein L226DRAFT_387047 [Lentinus tigrinus ALCF2SS1-7]